MKIFGGAVTFFEVVEEEQIIGCCLCRTMDWGKLLCEVGSLGLAAALGRGCGCGYHCYGCGCGFGCGCLQPSCAVKMGHMWSLEGRDFGQVGGKDIGVWVGVAKNRV